MPAPEIRIEITVESLRRVAHTRYGYELDEASARHIIGQMDRAVQMDVDRWMQAARSTQIILDNKEG
jgi:ABC-type uncharacterized transport system substrate-binding protein